MNESNTTSSSGKDNSSKPIRHNGHRDKIKWSSIAIYILLALFGLIVAPLWLFVRAFFCSSQHENLSFCEYSFGVPAGLALAVIAVLVYLVLVMRDYGRTNEASMMEADRSRRGVMLAARHVRHGYRSFEKPNQNHIRRSHLSFWGIAGACLGFVFFYYEFPTYIAFLSAGALIVVGSILDQVYLK